MNNIKIGDKVLCNGIEDTVLRLLENDPDGYEVELKENGTQTFGCIELVEKQN